MKLRRGYLNNIEENFYMMCATTLMFIHGDTNDTKGDNMVDRFNKAGMLTSSSKKNLKSSITFMAKFLKETYESLDEPMRKKLDRKLNTFYLKFITKHEADRLDRIKNEREKYVHLERETFDKVIHILGNECVNCNKDYKECDLFNVFQDGLVSSCGEKENCLYAVDL